MGYLPIYYKMKIKYFATFGGGQLEGFKVNSMKVMVYIPDVSEYVLRAAMQEEPINNKYCTTYPIDRAAEMERLYSMYLITYDDLMKLNTLKESIPRSK